MSVPADALVLSDPADWHEALTDVAGPQLILAGPGTGKTEFLARRVAHLLETGVGANRILVLTFSRRAAAELEARISALLPRPVSGATASTFHSFAHRLVEAHRHRRGEPMPVLLTGPEQVRLVGRLLEAEDPADWPVTFRPLLSTPTLAEEVADFVMRCQERLLDSAALRRLAAGRSDWRALPAFLDRYRSRLREENKIDYGTLVADATEILADPVDGAAGRYDYVVVDEYQDTSPAQARLAELAAGEACNLTVAADPHQSIYSFRGAELANVEGFPRSMEQRGQKVRYVALNRSLRVPVPILESAQRLVEPNRTHRLPRFEILPAPHAGSVEAYTFHQRSAEAEWIASEIERLHLTEGLPLSAMAVLVRSTRHLLPELSRALDRRQIPHDRPDTRLVDQPAVRIVADVVEAALSPEGSASRDLAVRRLLLGPLVALPLSTERELQRARQRRGETWPALIRRELPAAASLADLLEDPSWATAGAAVEGFWHLWDRLPGLERLATEAEFASFREAWSTFSRMLERQAERDPTITLADSLAATYSGDFEASPQLRHVSPGTDRLVVTTLHQAKGLEFEVVFIADAIEGTFPDNRRTAGLLQPHLLSPELTTDPAAQARFRLEEERRLAYTATTRARRRVVWTATTASIDEGERRPSRFILAATGAVSFDEIGPPPTSDEDDFEPLTPTEAQALLRRIVVDPSRTTVDRLAALRSLVTHPRWDPRAFAGVPAPGPDTGVITADIRLSPSQAELYARCPRLYVLDRRLRAVDIVSPYAQFGSIIHAVLEETEREALEAGLPHGDLGRALVQLERVWEQHPPFGPPEWDDSWKRRAVKFLEQIYADWPGGNRPAAALEIELELTIDGVRWVGRADRVDISEAGIKVIDYKSSKSPPTLKEAAASLQLGFYLLAAAEHPELRSFGPPVGAELWYPLAERRKVFPFDMANLDTVHETLVEISRGIRAENWEPRIGAHCERCPFRQVCPAWPEGREAYS
ncbi:MAG TPA: ATP-dependent DNA helicase [Acidimicrobiia bacterium]